MGCPMGFGELNIPSSRAFWDDCDEDELAQQKVIEKLKLEYAKGYDHTTETTKGCNLFVVIEGTSTLKFVEKTLLQGGTKICKIPSKNSSLYRVKNNLIAIIEEDLTSSGEVTELLLPYVERAKQVVALAIKPKVEYKSENISEVREVITFIRGINSTLKEIRELEAPNFIAGVAAGIASWRENQKLPVSAYVAYTDNISLDTLAAEPILKLFQQLDLECAKSYTSHFKDESYLYT